MKALIIGGGIAGPVTALALRKAGIDSVVYEAYDSTADGVGGMLTLAPNGLAALSTVGLDLEDLGDPITRMVIMDSSGHRLGSIDSGTSRVVWRTDLYRALHDHAKAQGIKVVHGKRLEATTEENGTVTARFDDGSGDTGDLLIGADGIRSTVRTIIDPGAPQAEYVGMLGFGSYAHNTKTTGEPHTMYFVFGRQAFLGYWPQPDGTVAWFSNLPSPRMTLAESREVPATTWLARLREAYGDDVPAQELLAHSDDLLVAGPMEIMPSVPRWHRGRMVLVGDSAHAPSASSGQGASLAAESAVQLARCLRDISDVPTAFATYESLRRPRVEKIAARAAKTNSDKRNLGPIARLLMPIMLKAFGRRAFAQDHGYRIDWDSPVTTRSSPHRN